MNSNAIAFTGLANEYCNFLENASNFPGERSDFVEALLRMLPRIYIMATDLAIDNPDDYDDNDGYLESALDEDYYDAVRRSLEEVFGPDDIYLEVFEEDMKFSDTPVSASISEGLADIFQVLYNYVSTIRNEATDEVVAMAITSVRDDFRAYWSATLCNVLRALNALAYNAND